MEIAPYRQYRPSVLLADYVECYWAWRSMGPSARAERLIPGGRVELAFNFADEMYWLMDNGVSAGTALREFHVVGQRDRIYYCRAAGRVELFGVRFRHGCFGAFSPTPQSHLLNQLLPGEELFGPMVADWHARLRDVAGDAQRVDAPAGSLTDIGYTCGYYDQAHFIKDFQRFAGLSPREFRQEESMVAKYLIRNQAV